MIVNQTHLTSTEHILEDSHAGDNSVAAFCESANTVEERDGGGSKAVSGGETID